MPQEAQIIGIKEPDVVNAIPQHRQPFDADAESKTGILLRIYASVTAAQSSGIRYLALSVIYIPSGAEYLQPTGVSADPATGSLA